MNSYETSATVQDQGQIHVTGTPFAPGTQVDVTITAAQNGNGTAGEGESLRARLLLAALDKARNFESVGPLRRADLYDRDILR